MKNILLLGATGSIGDSVLRVIEQNSEVLNLYGIACNSNLGKASEIIKKFSPNYTFIDDPKAYESIKNALPRNNTLHSEQDLMNLINDVNVDIIISAIVGFAGLKTSFMAVNAGKTVLVANKESIVAAGDILMLSLIHI